MPPAARSDSTKHCWRSRHPQGPVRVSRETWLREQVSSVWRGNAVPRTGAWVTSEDTSPRFANRLAWADLAWAEALRLCTGAGS